MTQALSLCSKATRTVLPNPSVGAVITWQNTIIGQGYHKQFGAAHAEVHAIQSVTAPELLSTSTLYVTLEPCCHTGKTPPCVEAILKARIPRVVVGCRDPYPRVAGGGVQALRAAGVEVIENILHDECVLANHRFILSHVQRRPYIILKWAQTQDGFISPSDRTPLQISSSLSHQLSHYWRSREMAIAVGTKTACADNPRLTVRDMELFDDEELPPFQPTRVVIGNGTRLPVESNLYQPDAPTIISIPSDLPLTSREPSITTFVYDRHAPLVSQICQQLFAQGILSVIIEGGAVTLQHFLDADLWDEARIFTAPMNLHSGVPAPDFWGSPTITASCGGDLLQGFAHPSLALRLGVHESSITDFLKSSMSLARLPLTLHEPGA